jgi:gluconolactonase
MIARFYQASAQLCGILIAVTSPSFREACAMFLADSALRPPVAFAAGAILFGLCGHAAAAACGQAPLGELRAGRIAAAAPTQGGRSLYEGPVWIGDSLYFSEFRLDGAFPARIRRLAPDGSVSTFIEDSGSNGLAVDARGDLVAATHKFKGLSRYAIASGKGERSTIAGSYQGQVFDSPNDIAIARDGTIYFTDPDYQKAAAPGGQPVTGIYRVTGDGKVTLVDGSRRNPNGIALSPAGDVLYANAGDNAILAYPIVNGIPDRGRPLVTGIEGGDGMAVDCHGNLYQAEHGARRVRVFSPQGRELATIRVDANVTNVAFGGKDGKTLYITGAGALWQLRLEVSGSPY